MKDPSVVKNVLAAAMRLAMAGRHEEALRELRSRGEVALKHPLGRNIQGNILLAQGKAAEALRAFDSVVMAAGGFPEGHCNRGVALQQLRRHDAALQALNRAIELRPDYAMAHFNRGNVLRALDRLEDSVAAYGLAIKHKADFAEAILNRGLTLLRLKRFQAALDDGERVLGLRPGNVDAKILTASTLAELGRGAEAIARLDDLPESAAERIARASALRQLGRYDEALSAADRAVELEPRLPETHSIRGVVLGEHFRVEDQLAAFRTAIGLAGRDPRFHHSLAVALSEAGRAAEAREAYAAAIGLAPDDPWFHYHSSLIRLYLGDFDGGFEEHEWRLKSSDFHGAAYLRLAPTWTGEPIEGKSILVYPEQGIGDAIQFMRYLPLVLDRGAKVSLHVSRPLRAIAAASFPGIELAADALKSGEFDYQVSLLSLARVFRTGRDTVPARVPYLATDPERVEKWRRRLGEGGFRIGVAWQGNPALPNDRFRSVDPIEFVPLAGVPDVRLISLQAVHGLEKLEHLAADGPRIESFGEEIANNPDGIVEIAALMQNLDLVVSVDSATAHLAGALARPVFVAIRKQPEWRWMEGRSDSPWYPTMRVFRQPEVRAWKPVFEEIKGEIERRLATKAAGGLNGESDASR